MTSPIDYNQQLLSYLQAWRQLLAASTAMTSGLPLPPTPYGMPPAPPMPIVPPMPPAATGQPMMSAPTDYTQQLFAYLQLWRQYLEQAIGVQPGGFASAGPQPTGSEPTGSQPTQAQPTGSQSSGSQSGGSQSGGLHSPSPVLVPVPPDNPWGTGIVADNWASKFSSENLLSGPEARRTFSADRGSGSAFAAKAGAVTSGSSTQVATQSLFSRRGAETASATGSQTGRDARRAAQPAARWWEAGEGRGAGVKEKPSPMNILNVPPVQEFGERE